MTGVFADIRRGVENRFTDEVCELKRKVRSLRLDVSTLVELLGRARPLLLLRGQASFDSSGKRRDLVDDMDSEMKHLEPMP